RVLNRLSDAIGTYPNAFGYLASQLDFALGQPHEIALVGDPQAEDMRALLDVIRKEFRPNQVVAMRKTDEADPARLIPLLEDRRQLDGAATAYVCHNYVCRLPVTSADALRQELEIDLRQN
ncbi:MAG: thioredoxin domain-containing protein, partial [Chloroflexota bacterium]